MAQANDHVRLKMASDACDAFHPDVRSAWSDFSANARVQQSDRWVWTPPEDAISVEWEVDQGWDEGAWRALSEPPE